LLLRFWHWFQWGGATGGAPGQGVVQISVFDTTLLTWSAWTNVSTIFSSSSGVWTLNLVDLTAFSGEVVRIRFFHMGANAFSTGAGWYVDEIEIIGVNGSSCPDEDGDGEADPTDLCPGTPVGEAVDEAGCSQEQFCSAIDATTRQGQQTCKKSDWRNDEPLKAIPADCKVDLGGPGSADDLCVSK
jgi:hypothetical protein